MSWIVSTILSIQCPESGTCVNWVSINESIVSIETHLRCHPHPVSFFVSINSSSDNIVSIDKYYSISIIFINCYLFVQG